MSWFNRDELVELYQSGIDSIHNELSKPVRLFYRKTLSSVTSTNRDGVRPGDSRLPDFKSDAPTVTEQTEDIEALIQWSPKNIERYGLRIEDASNIVRIKVFKALVPKLMQCSHIVPNVDQDPLFWQKCERLTHPVPYGFGDDRYAVSFWKRIAS